MTAPIPTPVCRTRILFRSWMAAATLLVSLTPATNGASAQESPLQLRERLESQRRVEVVVAEVERQRWQRASLRNGQSPATPTSPPAQPSLRLRTLEAVLQVAGCAACGQLSVIEEGELRGEGSWRVVRVGRFEIGRTEVTQGQWRAVMGSNPSAFKICGDACPVEGVSWEDITGPGGFLARLKDRTGVQYRLASEVEWEYAARAGSRTAFWWGNDIQSTQSNYDGGYAFSSDGAKGAYRQRTVRADRFEGNPWGLYNVHGNVWEWVQDCWHDSLEMAPSTGLAWEQNCDEASRVVRGGSWFNHPWNVRSASRNRYQPDTRRFDIGFRLARTP